MVTAKGYRGQTVAVNYRDILQRTVPLPYGKLELGKKIIFCCM